MSIASTFNHYAAPLRWASIALIAVAFVVAIRALPLQGLMAQLSAWVEGLGWAGYVVFFVAYVLATLLFIPGSLLTLGAAPLFGLLKGTIVVSVSSVTGAALAFLVARYLASRRVAQLKADHPRFAAVDKAIAREGWKIVALVRLSPAFPFNLQNYLYGLTSIGFVPYVLASWIAMLPGTFMYVYLGYIGAAGLEEASGAGTATVGQWALRLVGLLATVAVTIYVTRIARRALAEHTEEEAPAPKAPPTDPERTPWGLVALLSAAIVALAAAGLLTAYQAQVAQALGLGG